MDIKGKTIRQIAAGNGKDTHYANLCLQKDVILVGPGKYGAWPECEILMRADGWTAMKAGIIRRFAEDIEGGDIVVLRVGTQQVYGVGEVVGGYGHSSLFKNVQGWDLHHFRRVRWLWHQDGRPKEFAVHTLKRGRSVQYLNSSEVHLWLQSLNVPQDAYDRALHPL